MAAEGLVVTSRVRIPEDEIQVEGARSGGPGGQNVNKVATKVVLRFRPGSSRAFGPVQRQRVLDKLAGRLTTSGELVLHASRHRERRRNLEDARERLAAVLREALAVPKVRKATRPTRASKQRRLDAKRRRGRIKRERRGGGED